jgi:transposase
VEIEEEEHKENKRKRSHDNISDSTRIGIINFSNNGDTPTTIYNSLHGTVNLNTIKTIIFQYKHNGKIEKEEHIPPPNPHPPTSEEVKSIIVELQRKNNQLTQYDIQNNIPLIYPSPSQQTISRVLKEKGFTTKILRVWVEGRSTDKTKELRIEFVHKTENELSEDNTIFIDETPWSMNMHRTTGRSEVNVPATYSAKSISSPNITLIAAISPSNGLIHYETHNIAEEKKGVDRKRFNEFIKNLLEKDIFREQSYYLIMDNAQIHKGDELEDLLELRKEGRLQNRFKHYLCFFPPYTPQLNPIENIFGIWKRDALKTTMRTKEDVLAEIEKGKEHITQTVCENCYKHTLTYFIDIMKKEDLY